MKNIEMDNGPAALELVLLDAEAKRTTAHEIYDRLLELGVPPEIVYRLSRLWRHVRRVGGRVVAVGKIILMKMVEFITKHPGLCAGVALGAALAVLASHVPWLGPVLGPIAALVGIPLGAAVGHAIDSNRCNDSVLLNAVRAAMEFFKLLVELMRICVVAITEPSRSAAIA